MCMYKPTCKNQVHTSNSANSRSACRGCEHIQGRNPDARAQAKQLALKAKAPSGCSRKQHIVSSSVPSSESAPCASRTNTVASALSQALANVPLSFSFL